MMGPEVVEIVSQPKGDVVVVLRQLLDMAEKGEIRSFAACWVDKSDVVSTNRTAVGVEWLSPLLGGIEILKHELLERFN